MGRLDARSKAEGRAQYVADIDLPGLVYGASARSTEAHARILHVETTNASKYPGVIGVYTAADMPQKTYGRGVVDIPILAREKVRFVGERVAVVVAESAMTAEDASRLIEVEYEPIPAVTTAEEALQAGAPLVHDAPWEYPRAYVKKEDGLNLQSYVEEGSREAAESALQSSRWSVDETYRMPGVHQGYLEPQACVAATDPSGRIRLWSTNKSPYRLRGQLAEYFEIDPSMIEIQPIFIGGDFGGKGSIGDTPLAIEISRIIGRPVKFVLHYSEELIATNPRHPAAVRIRMGCDGEGHLTGVIAESVLNGGAYAGYKADPNAMVHGVLEPPLYRTEAFYCEGRMAYTNTVPHGSMRAPGAPQMNFAFESALDELALLAKLSPVEMRNRNVLVDGERPALGRPWAEYRGQETLEIALGSRRDAVAPDSWLRGTGYSLYARGTRTEARTSLKIVARPSGGLRVELPITETGTGSHTVMRELIGQRLEVPMDQIEIVQVDTGSLPWDHGAGGSRVTSSMALAVDSAMEAWDSRGDTDSVEVDVKKPVDDVGFGSFAIEVAEVAVDPATGQVKVLELLLVVDIAEIINPAAHQMQIDGGAVMGYGYACLEDLDESDGQVWAANLGEFKIPAMRDSPVLRTILVPGGKGVGTANVKMVGELTTPGTAAAIANAIFDATGCRLRELPLTAERVLDALEKAK